MPMAVRCKIVVDDEQDVREVTFDAVPRVGELIGLGDAKQPCRVTSVLHETDGGPTAISIQLTATRQML
jgi:hypothetical protein